MDVHTGAAAARYVYIYRERERERSKWVDEGGSLCVCVHRSFTLYIYIGSLIYIYILGI